MEQTIQDMFSDDVVDRGASNYGLKSSDLKFIGGFQNFIYEYELEGFTYIMRFTPSPHRSYDAVNAELDYIQYLAENGLKVSEPVHSAQGALSELIQTEQCYFTCCAFKKAPGSKVNYPECLEDHTLYEKLGRYTGKMHALSKGYQPKNGSKKRHDWTQNYYLQNIDVLPSQLGAVKKRYFELIHELSMLSKYSDSYGLIHNDINVGNFHLDEQGEITLFDFDEAQYSWFAEDIAVQLYYLVYVYGGEKGKKLREEQASRFMEYFMKGYIEENLISEDWLKQIPLFLQLRELIVFIGAFRNYDGDVTFSSSDNQWFKDWIRESRNRLETGEAIVNIWN
ncbi:phosphotransferase [Neobacillus mesonae]|nr:phosphotransferase [Neobacillus mesonae]